MAGPNHIVSWSPETKDQLSVWTRMEALTDRVLNNWRRVVMGTLAGLAMAISSPAMAQDMVAVKAETPQWALTPNPEFDRIIAEAQKAWKDPVDYALSKWKTEAFAEGLDSYIIKKTALERRTREWQLDQAAMARKSREAELDKTLAWRIVAINATAMKLIASLEKNRKEGNFKKSDLDTLKEIYNRQDVSDEVKKLIQQKFWDLFDFRTLIAQA